MLFGVACLLIVLANYFGEQRESAPVPVVSENQESRPKLERQGEVRTALIDLPAESNAEALEIAPADIKAMESETERTLPKREISKEDSILMKGGVLENQSASVAEDSKRVDRLKSIRAEDWEGKSNLLVNALRAGNGFEVKWENVEDFLKGKQSWGWPEGARKWIGDEMMSMLRQEMPQEAYHLFRDIVADADAPDAMRDYGIQHISHLVADQQQGGEAVEVIRKALLSGDPVVASTALMSLHRLSESAPQWVGKEEVKTIAKRYFKSSDNRLRMSADAILKEAQ